MRHKTLTNRFRYAAFSLALLLLASSSVSPRVSGQSVLGETSVSAPTAHLSRIPERLFRQFGGLIQLDVVVTDLTGRPVTGLKASDFNVLDNGQPTTILGFLGHGSASKPDPPVELDIVLDLGNMRPEVGSDAKKEVIGYLQRNGGHLANPVSVFAINSAGMIDSAGASTDGKALAAELAHPKTPPAPCQISNSATRFVHNGDVTDVPSDDWNAAHEIQPNLLSLICLGRIAVMEKQKPGRKILIWVGPQNGASSGVDPVNWKDPNPQTAFDTVVWFSTLFREARITLFSTWAAANESNSPPTLSLNESGASAASLNLALANRASPSGLGGAAAVQPVRSAKDVRPTDLTRNVLAFDSGGGVPGPSLQLVKVIDSCARWADTFYSISFDPTAATQLDEYHDLKVQMKGSGLIARTNPGYYDEPFYTNAQRPATRRVTDEELVEWLNANSGKSDAELAQQIASFELTERLEGPRLANLLASIRGKKAHDALVALADLASFLPASLEAHTNDSPPAPDEQEQIMAKAQEYLKTTITRFPDFMAARRTALFEERTNVDMRSRKIDLEPMHLLKESEDQVIYRQGHEIVDADTGKGPQRSSQTAGLTTYGVFGPSLQIMREIVTDSSLVRWDRWEQGSGGRVAVFTYSVPASRSLYQVKACCLPDGKGTGEIEVLPGHHGEIAIDTATGAILRLSVLADIKGFLPILKSDLVITYGPVDVGGKAYMCPVKSVTVFTGRSRLERASWGLGFWTYGPLETQLSGFEFDNYHIFRSSSRVLPGDSSAPQ